MLKNKLVWVYGIILISMFLYFYLSIPIPQYK